MKTGIFILTAAGFLSFGFAASAAFDKAQQMTRAEKIKQERVIKGGLINHVVAADSDGLAVHPQENTNFTSSAFAAHIDHLLDEAELLGMEKEEVQNGKLIVKILVHVHGGLNRNESTLDRVERFAKAIQIEPEEWAYPIFVRWPSGPWDTYSEHLVVLRGNKSPKLGFVSAPFVFATDLIQFCAHAPVDWFFQGVNTKDRTVTTGMLPKKWFSRNWKIAEHNHANYCSQTEGDAVCYNNTYWGNYEYNGTDKWLHRPADVLQGPFQATIGTLGQGTIAQAAWENMKRRTSNMLHPAPLFDIDEESTPEDIQRRALGYFFQRLNERAKTASGMRYRITFVGHSMGAIVLNKVFTEYRNSWIEGKTIENIIYMGAADSINNTVKALRPILESYNQNPDVVNLRFHNLTLNRVAEISERPAWGFAPRGSLLEYIDQHLENPETAADRTMGSEINVFQALHVFDSVRKFCQFKSFDRKSNCIPGKHGEFNDCPFWRRKFREVPGDVCYPANWPQNDVVIKKLADKPRGKT